MTGNTSDDSVSAGPSSRILDKGKGKARATSPDRGVFPPRDPDEPIQTTEPTDTTTPVGLQWGDYERVVAERDAVFKKWDDLLPAFQKEVQESSAFLDRAEAKYERLTGKRVADFDYEKEREIMNKKLGGATKSVSPFGLLDSISIQPTGRLVEPIPSPETRHREGMSAINSLNLGDDTGTGDDPINAGEAASGAEDEDFDAEEEASGAGEGASSLPFKRRFPNLNRPSGRATGTTAPEEDEYTNGVTDIRAWNETEFVPLNDFVPDGSAHRAIMEVVRRFNDRGRNIRGRLADFLRACREDGRVAQDQLECLTCRFVHFQWKECVDDGSKYACQVCIVVKANQPCCKLYREPTGKWYVGFLPLPPASRESDAPEHVKYWVATKAPKPPKSAGESSKTKAPPAVPTRTSRRK